MLFKFLSVLASLALAHTALATPVARAACNPTMAGTEITIASGALAVGYARSTAGAPLVSKNRSAAAGEWIAEPSTVANGGFVLRDAASAGLYATWTSGALALEPLVAPEDGKQGWGFVCAECHDSSTVGAGGVIASACNVVSGWTGQCLQIGSAAGAPVAVANCADLGAGTQYFEVYRA
ncbi:hypothetical protein B0H15DRAFT_796449 [Mycena belliarum]|uniref:Uncharacterized protein n=1 Tax=Mycena belliarum TaxID=1033014 RepID=A0AAD6Y0C1_9AGAR|nr:hypothetical protein B0H15DRAFT_796449 [Mycena belliae]